MKRLILALLLLLALVASSPAAVRLDTNSDNIDFGDCFDGDASFTMSLVFRTQSGATSATNRLISKNTTASGTRGWGIRVHSGLGQQLRLNWYQGSTDTGTFGDASGANNTGVITDGVWYQLLIVYDSAQPGGDGNSHADSKVRVFLNGTEVLDGAGASIGASVTGAANNTASTFTIGKDSGSGTNNSAFFDIAELEFYALAVPSPESVALLAYNSGNFKRLKDLGYTVGSYHDFFTRSLSSFTDKAGGGKTGTGTGIAQGGASTTYIVHPPMGEPIATFTAATGVYNNDSGGSEPSNNGIVGRWEDQSGRQLHLTNDETGTNCPKYRKASGDAHRSIYFDKFPDSVNGDTDSAAWLAMPADTRFDSANYTVAAVVDSVGFKNEYNPATAVAGASDGSDLNNAYDRTILTLWCNDNKNGGRFTISRDSSGALSNGQCETGVLRSEATLMDSGGGQTTPSALLYVPSSPSLIVFMTNSGTTKKQAAMVNNFSAANLRTTTAAMASVATTGTFTIGYNPFNAASPQSWNHYGGFYRLAIFNRALGSLDAANEADIPSDRAIQLRAAYKDEGVITTTPTALIFFHGSSSTEGQAAVYGRNLPYLLWHRYSYYRGCWIYNYGSKRAQANADIQSDAVSSALAGDFYNIPSFDNHALDTTDIVAGRFTTTPKELWFWGGINDLNVGGRTGLQLFGNVKDFFKNRKTAFGSRVGGSLIPKVVALEVWRNTDTNGTEGTEIDFYNRRLRNSPYAGLLWNYVVRFTGTDMADMAASAANSYTDEDKHPTEAGFERILELVDSDVIQGNGKLNGNQFQRNRSRPLRVR